MGVVVAVSLAFAAVAHVASGVAPNDVDHLSQQAIDDELTTSRSSVPSSTTKPTVSSTTTTTSTTPTTTSPTGRTTPTSTRGASPTTTSPITTQTAPPLVTTTTGKPPPDSTTHNTVTTSQGGTLYTRCSGADSIVYVAAIPKPGYERTEDVERADGIRQSFENKNHLSTIEAECSDGVVHAHVEEEVDDD
jgi:hypothetical protein